MKKQGVPPPQHTFLRGGSGPRHECTSSTRSLSEGISLVIYSCISDAGSLPREMTSNSKFVEATLMLSMVNAMTKSLR